VTSPRQGRSLPPLHVHVPYEQIDRYIGFIRGKRLDLEIYFGSGSFDTLREGDIERLMEKLDYGPSLTLHAPFMDLSPGAVDQKIRDVTIRRFNEVLDVAEKLRPRVVVFHSGYDKWKYDRNIDIWLDGSLRTWRPLNERAAAMGVKIAIENIFEDEPENLRLLARNMDSENFGLCFDTGHFNLFSKLPLREWLSLVREYIRELHLHDNSRYRDEHLALGDGDFDFPTLFSELKDIDCVYTIEAHSAENVKKSLERFPDLFNAGG
jgi:sugar phosphate isomerase/epimerase